MEGGKRKREMSGPALESLIQGNPKQLLASTPWFQGKTQHQLPFYVSSVRGRDSDFEARLQFQTDKGIISALGASRTRKEAERLCAIHACRQLNVSDQFSSFQGFTASSHSSSSDRPCQERLMVQLRPGLWRKDKTGTWTPSVCTIDWRRLFTDG